MDHYDFKLGGIKCSKHSISQLLKEIELLLNKKALKPRSILCVNAHIYNIAYRDAEIRQILNAARIVAADGASTLLASKMIGEGIKERCNLTEAFRAFLNANHIMENRGILAGMSEYEANEAAKNINDISEHCHIVKAVSGFLPDPEYDRIFSSFGDIDFILLGMGTPRTEQVSKIAEASCPNAIIWGIGGGTIRIFARTMKEAPLFFRRTGLQWVYRLCSNPVTLWKRYLIGNPLFVYSVAKELLVKKNQPNHC